MKRLIYFGIALLFINSSAQVIPSFPGAEGFGANATGGRGGQVIYVTNLNASGPGSLNDALAVSGKKYILFKVSGLIDAAAEVIYGETTIAGQTSPGGITVRGFIVDEVYDPAGTGDNIIVRHLRSRPQDPAVFSTSNYILDDACRLDGASNVIIDHCSFANALDECVQISQSSNISFQYNSMAETLGEHYYLGGMLLNYSTPEHPQDNISIHHNIWNRLGGRLPEISCESPHCKDQPLHIELSNNIIWDQAINIWYNSNIDPTSANPIDSFFLNLNWINNLSWARNTFGNGMIAHNILEFSQNSIYANGNKMNLYPNYADYQLFNCCNDFNQAGNNPNTDNGTATIKSSRHTFPSITYTSTATLIDHIQNNSGAFPRDKMDNRLFAPLKTGIIDPTPVDGTDNYKDAFNTNPTTAFPQDSDNDGMPDYWENAHQLSNTTQDHNNTNLSTAITGVAGYTNLECYLNCLSDYLVSGKTTNACGIQPYSLDVMAFEAEKVSLVYKSESNLLAVEAPISNCTLKLYDLSGRMVFEQKLLSKSENIQINLPTGSYIYQLTSINNTNTSGKLLIN